MSSLTTSTLESHIASLQSTLSFLTSALDDLDSSGPHETSDRDPEWLATDLISLKGKTGMLVDEMRRVRKRMVSEGVRPAPAAFGSPGGAKRKRERERLGDGEGGSKRLSIEGVKRNSSPPPAETHGADVKDGGEEEEGGAEGGYQVQYVDVSAEVHKRLRESRLRQLMESPKTAQKRKFDDTVGSGDEVELEGGDKEREVELLLRSPQKKIKMIGGLQQVARFFSRRGAGEDGEKGKEGGGSGGTTAKSVTRGEDEREDRGNVKRRRI
ncbi:hypothetical protein BU24DRAFT_493509 [Aaosphaeria arxii CBS 175.79]|uniref:Uncharacterized protein n=1 Tax=Aaosphaeria arxii CBS 175.79 TaxID=1450172 RepID=A0A6A5XQM1_9PLEO|nr:uncharacterized protein BU24DRAFT_493509 [Aaosphaeria arxii CBS 175.79]KAF2015030.1 hypothetical protein BU24DRAFT_493509 [Aaosphaeria arxii CBS 175.79]